MNAHSFMVLRAKVFFLSFEEISMASSSQFNSAFAITNIKSLIPITLDQDFSQYHCWATLFKIHAQIHNVIDHFIPPKEEKTIMLAAETKANDPDLWIRLDAVVLLWIYNTISSDILNSILKVDDTAEQAWNRIAKLFQDNKHSRAMILENQFTNTILEDFPNTQDYCNRLKHIADQLANVDAPINNTRLVTRMIIGLTSDYHSFVIHIQQYDPLPSFEIARSKLALEETTLKQRQHRKNRNTGLITQNPSFNDRENISTTTYPNKKCSRNQNNQNQSQHRGGCRGGRGHGGLEQYQGNGKRRGGHGGRQQCEQQWAHGNPQRPWQQCNWSNLHPWVSPPGPYPTQQNINWAKSHNGPQNSGSTHNNGQGILGSHPSQAYFHGPSPNDINAALTL